MLVAVSCLLFTNSLHFSEVISISWALLDNGAISIKLIVKFTTVLANMVPPASSSDFKATLRCFNVSTFVHTRHLPAITAFQPKADFIVSSPTLHYDAATICGGHEADIHHVRRRAISAHIAKPDFPGIALLHQFFDVGGTNRHFMRFRR